MAKNKGFIMALLWLFSFYGNAIASDKLITNYELRITNDEVRKEIVKKGLSQIGVHELSGANDGVMVEKYLASVSLNKGNPWCAAFVAWCYDQLKILHPKSGYCPDWFKDSKRIVKVGQPGDMFGIWFANKGRIAHVGLIVKWDKDFVLTCEGNTNEAGSREGDGVYLKKRLKRQVYRVCDFIN